jgi:hypothetical protein
MMIGPGAGLAIATITAINPPPARDDTRAGANGGCRFNEHYALDFKVQTDGCCNVPSNLHANLYYQEQDVARIAAYIAVKKTRYAARAPPRGARAAAGARRGDVGRRLYRRYDLGRRTKFPGHDSRRTQTDDNTI